MASGENKTNNTKTEILNAALELFSLYGFEATSVAQIAAAVGIKKASLYSHYESKKDILDVLIEKITDEYQSHSIFYNVNWEEPESLRIGEDDLSVEHLTKRFKEMIRFLLHDPHISKVRKMLVIEQFQNRELAEIQSQRNYYDVFNFFTGMMAYMIKHNILKDCDPKIMAAQFAFPVSMWLSVCDREPEKEAEIMELVDEHIAQFFNLYKK